ncbi:hypothetical protein D3C87_1957180 [compost metagenome]
MAGIQRLQMRQLIAASLDAIGQLQKQTPPLSARRGSPGWECALGGCHGEINVFGLRRGNARDQLAIGRIDDIDLAPFEGGDELAINEQLVLHEQRLPAVPG